MRQLLCCCRRRFYFAVQNEDAGKRMEGSFVEHIPHRPSMQRLDVCFLPMDIWAAAAVPKVALR
jgi:hypothetical protein